MRLVEFEESRNPSRPRASREQIDLDILATAAFNARRSAPPRNPDPCRGPLANFVATVSNCRFQGSRTF
jgi:hypothetical protein